jgi:hypothetical protein
MSGFGAKLRFDITAKADAAVAPRRRPPVKSRNEPANARQYDGHHMLQPLEIAVAQPVCVPGDVAANVVAHRDVVGEADARLVVFPELSISGYVLDSPALDVTADVFAPLVGTCADRHTIGLIGADWCRRLQGHTHRRAH